MAARDGSGPFGLLLVRYRLAAGLSQEELAERAGVSRRAISDLERGARRAPHPSTLRRLTDALNLDTAECAALLSRANTAMTLDAHFAMAAQAQRAPATQRDIRHPDGSALPSFAELLRRCRLKAGLTQDVLANKAGLSVRAISDLERGSRRFPYPDTLKRLVDALELAADDRALLEAAAVRVSWPAQIQVGRPAATAAADSVRRHNLPVQLTSFVGRAQQIADVLRELARTRLLTLTGPGGVGKTRLALRVAEEELGAFPDGIWFAELASLTESTLLPQTIATLFNVREKPDELLIASLARALEPLDLLLILDNCEHLLPACVALVHQLLRACPRLVILTTSREVLGLAAETVWRVSPLGVSSADSEAAELFVERAGAVQPGFAISPQNAPAVREICQRLEGIPLAIELAASRISMLGLEQLVERLATDSRFLVSKDRTAARRQQTLENTIQWSYDLLTAEEQSLFDRLSAFAGGWTLGAMEAVASNRGGDAGKEPLELLEHLIDKSMVQVDDAPGRLRRYRLLEPLRQFAHHRLERRGDLARTHERHAAFFLELFERAEQEFLERGATPALVRRMDEDVENLRVALRWLIGQVDAERAQRLAGSARVLWLNRAYLGEGRGWLAEALALDASARPHDPAARARALLGMIAVAWHQGDLATAADAGLRSLQLFEELHDAARTAGALTFLGTVTSARADLLSARRFIERALLATRESGPHATVALNLCGLAELDLEQQDPPQALRHAEEALKFATAAADAQISCRALTILAEAESCLDRHDTAQLTWQAALKYAAKVHEPYFTMVPALIRLGHLASDSSDARFWLSEGLVRAREVSRWDVARGLEVMVEIAATAGQLEYAFQFAGAAAALRDSIGAPLWPSERGRLDATLTSARRTLSEPVADAAWTAGRTIPVDQILGIAIDFLEQSSPGSAKSSTCAPVPDVSDHQQ